MPIPTPQSSPLQVLRRGLFWVSVPLFFINFALPVQSKSLGASAFEIGGLFSLFTLALIFLRPVIGVLLDQFGRKPFLLFALLLYALAFAGYGMATEMIWMYAARLLQGIGAAFLLLCIDSMTMDLVEPSERAGALGANLQIQSRANFVGATIGFGLLGIIPAYGWIMSFSLFAIFALGSLLWVALKLPETRPGVRQKKTSLPTTQPMRRFLFLLMPLGFVHALVQPIYLVYLQDVYTPDVRLLSLAFLPAGIIYAVLPAKAGKWVDRIGPMRPLIIGLIVAALIYAVLPLLPGFWFVVTAYTGSAVAWAFIEPARKSLAASLVNQDQLARGFGLTEMFYGIGATAGPLVGGYAYDQMSRASAFQISAGISVLTIFMLLYFFQNTRVQQVEPVQS